MVGFRYAVSSSISLGADFFIYWQAGRAVAVNHVNPYSEETTEIIQQGIYGRLAKPDEDQVAYAYPPSGLLPVFPSVWMTYPWAEAYWWALNVVLLYCAVISFFRKPPAWLLASLIFFYPVSRSLILGPFPVLIVSGLIFAFGQIRRNEDLPAGKQWLIGGILAWCLMKPQFAFVPILLLLIMCLRKKYWKVFWGLTTGACLFALVSWILVPTWLSDWLNEITKYVGYIPIKPVIQSWLSIIGLQWSSLWVNGILALIAGVISIAIFMHWWKGRLPDFILFGWAILINQLVNPNANSLLTDQIIFLLPLFAWIMDHLQASKRSVIVWAAFLIVPWALFAVYFTGKEPFQAASGSALLFLAWWLAILVDELTSNKRKKNGVPAL